MEGSGFKETALKVLAGLAAAGAIAKLSSDASRDLKKAQEHRDRAAMFQEKAKMYGGYFDTPDRLPARGYRFSGDDASHDGVSPNSNQRGQGRLDEFLYSRNAVKRAAFKRGITKAGVKFTTAVMPDRLGRERRYYFFERPEGTVLTTRVPRGMGNNVDSTVASWSTAPQSSITKDLIRQAYAEFKSQRGGGRSLSNIPTKYGKEDHVEFRSSGQGPATSDAYPLF